MNRKQLALRQFIATALALLGVLFLVAKCTACGPPLTAAEKRAEAAAGYEAQQMRCIEQYADTAHIDACRDKVKARWATDGGKDGSQ